VCVSDKAMSKSTQGCHNTRHTIKSKIKTAVKNFFRAIKAIFIYKKNGLCESSELACPPPLLKADTDMITKRELAELAARNNHTACTAITGGTTNISPRGPLLSTRSASLGADSRRQSEANEWASFLHRRSGSGRKLLL